MNIDELFTAVGAIKQSNPENLMARHFNEPFVTNLEPALRDRLMKVISSGLKNPDSQMGAYAMNPDDYELFSEMLDPMIRAFHEIPPGTEIAQKHDWDSAAHPSDLSAIDTRLKEVSMRVRVGRNLGTFPLPGAMNQDQRVALEETAAEAFSKLAEDAAFGGSYLSITPGSPHQIDNQEYQRRVDAHQMFKDMSVDRYLDVAGISNDWPYGRGMYVSEQEDFLVWVGEEDHLRIMSMQKGGDLGALFNRLHAGLTKLQGMLPAFAMSPVYGSITSCPTNLGASMRASLHLKLPKLTRNGQDISTLKEKATELGLAVRGVGGEHSDAGADGLVDISPSARLGVTEMQIMRRLYDGAAALWALENA
ncbi:MAG: phosphagen kinase [Hyphomicrobiales bacterium]